MKTIALVVLRPGMALLLSSCLYTDPVFTENLGKADGSLNGVWATQETGGDPRTNQFAVCAALNEESYLVHHPAGRDGGIYYEARPLKRAGRMLLQLRVVATFDEGVPSPDAERFTLLWLQPQKDGTLAVSTPDGPLESATSAEARELLEDPKNDWKTLFGAGQSYRKLDGEQ